MDINKIDINFQFDTNIEVPGIRFYDVLQAPFSVHGVFHQDGRFRRMPEQVAKAVNGGVDNLHTNTAGGRVRFRTDSPYIAIHSEMPTIQIMSHCALTGSSSFDLYMRDDCGMERFVEVYKRAAGNLQGYDGILYPTGSGMREYTINFPTYSSVDNLYIGLDENASLEAPTPYTHAVPVVFYGSSITQGACASRPGSIYESIVSRRFDFDYINLGFSGSAKGEQAIADYIAQLKMSVFVYDYDYNADNVHCLAQTHEKMFQTIRKAHPDIPIIMMSKPIARLDTEAAARLDVIRQTYENAKKAGDQNVYLIEGTTLMALAGDDGMVDFAHPNDFGFGSMAKAVGDVFEKFWK